LFAARTETRGAIARRLGVSRQSVMRWHRAWREGGRTALRAAGRFGRKPRLTARALAGVERALRQGPRAHGFRTHLWTLPRVTVVIKRLTGVQYHPGHVWRIMGALDWTPPRVAKRTRPWTETSMRNRRPTRWSTAKKLLDAAAPEAPSRMSVREIGSRSRPPHHRPAKRRP